MKAYYINNHSILAINQRRKIRTPHTPFRVYNPVDSTRVYVKEVGSGPKDELLYFIDGQAFLYYGGRSNLTLSEGCAPGLQARLLLPGNLW
jgi:hypothetical protein